MVIYSFSFVADRVTFTLTHLDLSDRSNCSNTYLAIYDGVSVESPLIGKYCSRTLPHQITSQVSNLPSKLSNVGDYCPF